MVFGPVEAENRTSADWPADARGANRLLDDYLDAGSDLVPGPLGGQQAAWTVLAERIAAESRRDPAFREAWRNAYAERVREAKARDESGLLTRLAERAVAAEDPAMPPGGPHAEEPEAGATSGESGTGPWKTQPTWTASGGLVPSDPAGAPRGGTAIIVADGSVVAALDAAGGTPRWKRRLPEPEDSPPDSVEVRSGAAPFHTTTDYGHLVVLPDLAFTVDPADRRPIWSEALLVPSAEPRRIPSPRRFDAIQWVRRGRPAHTQTLPRSEPRRIDIAIGREWMVRWADGLPAMAVRLTDGRAVEWTGPRDADELARPQATLAREHLCLLEPERNMLSVLPGPDAAKGIRWRLPMPNDAWYLQGTPGGLAVLNDLEKVLVVEARTLQPVSRWRSATGIGDVLLASDEAIVVSLQDGGTWAYPPDAPHRAVFVSADEELRPEWAQQANGIVLLVEAGTAGDPGLRDRRGPLSGDRFRIRAVELSTGNTLWERRVRQHQDTAMPVPRLAGDHCLLCIPEDGAVRIMSVDLRTGAEVWALERPGAGGGPVAFDLVAGRLVVGTGVGTAVFDARRP
jgi:outer membrane protein assembly factor BamB